MYKPIAVSAFISAEQAFHGQRIRTRAEINGKPNGYTPTDNNGKPIADLMQARMRA